MINPQILTLLRSFKILDALTLQELEAIATCAKMQNYAKNTHIYSCGDKMEYIYFLVKGNVKLANDLSHDRSITKELVYDYEIFGENIFTKDIHSKEYAQTLCESKVILVPIHIIHDLSKQNALFATDLIGLIVQKLKILEQRLQSFVYKKAKERIVEFICSIGKLRGLKIGINERLINHGMSHKEIACLTDTSRQTVARILNELKKENYIHYTSRKSSRILIRDVSELELKALVYAN